MSYKVKILKEGQKCRKCGEPVILKEGCKNLKKGQKYCFKSYLHCQRCKTFYMIESEKIFL